MADEPNENLELTSAPEDKSPGGWISEPECDDFLAQLVAYANVGIAVGVTLTVGGSLISGTLCGGAEYFKHMREQFVAGLTGQVLDLVEDTFKDRMATYEDSDETTTISYVHLRDAVIYNGGKEPIPSNGGVYWRGRLDKVSGFSLGVLKSERA